MNEKYLIVTKMVEVKTDMRINARTRPQAVRMAKGLVEAAEQGFAPITSVFVRHTQKAGCGGVFYWVEDKPEKGYEVLAKNAVYR